MGATRRRLPLRLVALAATFCLVGVVAERSLGQPPAETLSWDESQEKGQGKSERPSGSSSGQGKESQAVGAGVQGQQGAKSDSSSKGPYKPLRYEEDWRNLFRDPKNRGDFWDPDGDVYLTVGGEVRERYERFRNPEFGEEPQDPSGYALLRHLLHADLRVGPSLRFHAQEQYLPKRQALTRGL